MVGHAVVNAPLMRKFRFFSGPSRRVDVCERCGIRSQMVGQVIEMRDAVELRRLTVCDGCFSRLAREIAVA